MRTRSRWHTAILGIGIWLTATAAVSAQGGGGVGVGGGGGGMGGGGGAGGGGTAAGAGGQSVSGSGQSPLIAGSQSPLAATQTATGGSSAISSANAFRSYFASPESIGLPGGSGFTNGSTGAVPFGQALYGTTGGASGTSGGIGGRGGAGGTSFGGTSMGGARTGSSGIGGGGAGGGRAGGGGFTNAGIGGGSGFGGGTTGGTANVTVTRPFSPITSTRPQFAYSAVMRFRAPAPPSGTALQAQLQQTIFATTALTAPRGIQIVTQGRDVILRGSVEDDRERRLAEGMVRLTPGVGTIRNELTVRNPTPEEE